MLNWILLVMLLVQGTWTCLCTWNNNYYIQQQVITMYTSWTGKMLRCCVNYTLNILPCFPGQPSCKMQYSQRSCKYSIIMNMQYHYTLLKYIILVCDLYWQDKSVLGLIIHSCYRLASIVDFGARLYILPI